LALGWKMNNEQHVLRQYFAKVFTEMALAENFLDCNICRQQAGFLV